MAAVKIYTAAIRQRDYAGLRGLFHNSGVIGSRVIYAYDVYISSPFHWIFNELPPLIEKLFQLLERFVFFDAINAAG